MTSIAVARLRERFSAVLQTCEDTVMSDVIWQFIVDAHGAGLDELAMVQLFVLDKNSIARALADQARASQALRMFTVLKHEKYPELLRQRDLD